MKLDAAVLRYLNRDDFRVLTGRSAPRRSQPRRARERSIDHARSTSMTRAPLSSASSSLTVCAPFLVVLFSSPRIASHRAAAIEMGMKNHELVPTTLICTIAALQQGPGGQSRCTTAGGRARHARATNKCDSASTVCTRECATDALLALLSWLARCSSPPAAFKIINTLHRNKLIYHECKKYDGYRLTYLGYDYLALRTYVARGLISGLGRRIGVGKEADIYECCNEAGETMVLKIHRSATQ
jgi:hypothetical protein